MAYMSQENKKQIADLLKVAMKDCGLKYSLSVSNHSTLCMTVKSATRDFMANHKACCPDTHNTDYMRVNSYCVERQFTGECLEIIQKALDILNTGNFDESDSMSDYFHVGWHVDLSFGSWNKPFVVTEK